jgi:hypothetical protein
MQARFIQQSNDRTLPEDYSGPILLWDIDKTYLDTSFSSKRGLLAIPLEFAIDKRSVPGAVPLLRALRRGPGAQSALTPLYFVSGSPPQLRKVVEKKMLLDGVQFDGISFKDQWGLVRARRAKDIKRQIGYKVAALLMYRQTIPAAARWMLFGDDVESDAEAFLLFGEVCRNLRGDALRQRLKASDTHPDDQDLILALSEDLPQGEDPVERIFIHLSAKKDPSIFKDPRVVACRSYIQTALVLAHEARIQEQTVSAVAKVLRRFHMPESTLAEHVEDARQRLHIPDTLISLAQE